MKFYEPSRWLRLLAVCLAVVRWVGGGGKPRIDERAWEME